MQVVTEVHWVHSLVYTQIPKHLRKSRTNPNREKLCQLSTSLKQESESHKKKWNII